MSLKLVEKEQAGTARELYENMERQRGKVLNFFKMMAHKPDVLNRFLPFYQAIWAPGALSNQLKEVAYLRTSILNGCQY